MLISIFLNFFKKNQIQFFTISKSFFWNKKDKKNNIYKDYINKILYYNTKKTIEMNKINQKCFDILIKKELNKIKEEKRNSLKRSIKRISIHNLILTNQTSKNYILSNQKILNTEKIKKNKKSN